MAALCKQSTAITRLQIALMLGAMVSSKTWRFWRTTFTCEEEPLNSSSQDTAPVEWCSHCIHNCQPTACYKMAKSEQWKSTYTSFLASFCLANRALVLSCRKDLDRAIA